MQTSDAKEKTGARPGRVGIVHAFSSLKDHNYRWYWTGALGSFNAMQMQTVAQGWLVYQITDSPVALGLVTAAFGLPTLVLSLFGGVIADRVEKRKLLIVTQGSVAAIGTIIALLIATDTIAFWHLLVGALLTGAVFSFNMPGRQAMIADIVQGKDMMNAVALNSVGMNLTRIASPAIAGVLLGIIGIAGVYYLVVASYLFVVWTLLMIRVKANPAAKKSLGMRADLKEGLNAVRTSPVVFSLLFIAFVPVMVGMPYQMLMPVFAADVFQAGPTGLGMLMSATGVGALAGSLAIASMGDFKRKGLLLFGTGIVFGVALVLFAMSGSFIIAMIALLLVGAGSTGYMAVNNTLILTNTPQHLTGRVMSIYMMTFGLMPIGTLPAGALAATFGAPLTVAAGGAILASFLLIAAVFQPHIRKIS